MGVMDSRFIARMERLLWLYDKPYDPLFPVICFDERPCFLIGEVMAPLNHKPGQIAKEHYAYSKNGSCCLLAAIEPLTGARLGQVHNQRTKQEYALFLKALADRYPDAVRILLVQDNLNTHDISALYETFEAEEAFALAQRFEFHFTPKSASWLNMIEIEFSALSRQCLKRRIPTKEILECEVLSLLQERQDKAIKINWQFSIQKARTTFQTAYSGIRRNAE
jgi:transposase